MVDILINKPIADILHLLITTNRQQLKYMAGMLCIVASDKRPCNEQQAFLYRYFYSFLFRF